MRRGLLVQNTTTVTKQPTRGAARRARLLEMPASHRMKSIFDAGSLRRRLSEATMRAKGGALRRWARAYWTRVPTEAERPLGVRTVVVQLLKTARMMMAAKVGRRMAFIVLGEFLFHSETALQVGV